MSILNWQIQFPDQAADAGGQQTRLGTLACTDSFADVTTPGFLNQLVSNSANQGGILLPNAGYVPLPQDMWAIAYNGGFGWFSITISSGVVSLNLLTGDSFVASIPVSSAQFLGMYAAPKALLPAPGANKLILVKSMQLIMTYGAANYAAGGVVAAQYDSTINGAGVKATNTEAAADFFAAASTVFRFAGSTVLAPFATSVNKGLYLSNASGAFTTGDSNFVANIEYSILQVA